MNKLYAPFLILLSMISALAKASCCPEDCAPQSSCDCEATSRSYLAVRPQFQSVSPEMVSAFRAERTHLKEDGWNGAIQGVFFGGKSTNSEDLARYFFPFCKTVLYVDERIGSGLDIAATQPPLKPQDLLAQNFNIVTTAGTFRSKISIAPEQRVFGFGVHNRHSFCRNEDKGRGFWSSFSFPIVKVTNNLNFDEEIINDGGSVQVIPGVDTVGNMVEAFQQEGWAFGKIASGCCSDMSKSGVADIEWKLGYEWLDHEPCHLETYLGILIPTGNKPNAQYLFQPIVGNGRHWGIMFGNAVGVQVWKDEAKERSLRLEYANHSEFLFRNIQCRSVDLVGKPWSRYIELYSSQDQAIIASNLPTTAEQVQYDTPGINVLTIPLKVRPGFNNNMTASAVFNSRKFQGELGWNLYARQAECAKLACPWQEGPAIKHHDGAGNTNPIRDITGNFRLENIDETNAVWLLRPQDYKFNVIQESDLDIISATSPCLISYTVYGSLGWNWNELKYPFFINGGASYEFSHSNNAVMERWLAWFKLGFSY